MIINKFIPIFSSLGFQHLVVVNPIWDLTTHHSTRSKVNVLAGTSLTVGTLHRVNVLDGTSLKLAPNVLARFKPHSSTDGDLITHSFGVEVFIGTPSGVYYSSA